MNEERPLTGREAEEVQARFVREVLYGSGTGRPRGIVTDPVPEITGRAAEETTGGGQ